MRKELANFMAKVIVNFALVVSSLIGLVLAFGGVLASIFLIISVEFVGAGIALLLFSLFVFVADLEFVSRMADWMADAAVEWLEDLFLEMHPIKKIKEMIKNAAQSKN